MVRWSAGDRIGIKYPAEKDNIVLTLMEGEGTSKGLFAGAATSRNTLPSDPTDLVIYYPVQSTTAGRGGTVTDGDNFSLENIFPKVQVPGSLSFTSNLMFGVLKAVPGVFQNTENQTFLTDVKMVNAMALLDFTLKGKGKLKRIYVTDRDENAVFLYGNGSMTMKDGVYQGYIPVNTGHELGDRTIIAEFPVPLELTEAGVHAYVNIFPRSFAKGFQVGLELTDGDYMVRTLGGNEGFSLENGKVYEVPELTFESTAQPGKGFYDGSEFSYSTFTDPRDNNVYRTVTAPNGDVWMADNLRYVPAGMTPSSQLDDAHHGLWYPVVMNEQGDGLCFGEDADVARYGYCYNISVAIGKEADYYYKRMKACKIDNTVTEEELSAEFQTWEGIQGICPDGWHIPTRSDYFATGAYQLSILGCWGFVLRDFGSVKVSNISATQSASLYGYSKYLIETPYLWLSSTMNSTSFITMHGGIVNNVVSGSPMTGFHGLPLRCIKDK